MKDNCWLPEQELFQDHDGDWGEYEALIYAIFKHDFIDTHPSFQGKRVSVKKYPIENNKEDSFYHVTCVDLNKNNNRIPDMRRCERIRWIRAFIENYNCRDAVCIDCDGVKVWTEPYKQNRDRVHLLLEEERYIVILEPRDSYCLLITAYYLDQDHSLMKQIKRYERYSQSNSI